MRTYAQINSTYATYGSMTSEKIYQIQGETVPNGIPQRYRDFAEVDGMAKTILEDNPVIYDPLFATDLFTGVPTVPGHQNNVLVSKRSGANGSGTNGAGGLGFYTGSIEGYGPQYSGPNFTLEIVVKDLKSNFNFFGYSEAILVSMPAYLIHYGLKIRPLSLIDIVASAKSSGVDTITTSAPHGFVVGDQIHIFQKEVIPDIMERTSNVGMIFFGETKRDDSDFLQVGDVFVLSGCSDTTFNGTWTISSRDAWHIYFNNTGPDVPYTPVTTGTIKMNPGISTFNPITIATVPTTTTFTYSNGFGTNHVGQRMWGRCHKHDDHVKSYIMATFFSNIYWAVESNVDLTDGRAHHLCWTQQPGADFTEDPELQSKATVASYYVDGVLQGRDGGGTSNKETIRLGYDGYVGIHEGGFQHLAVYNRTLSEAEIRRHAAAIDFPDGGGYLVFDGFKWRQTLI